MHTDVVSSVKSRPSLLMVLSLALAVALFYGLGRYLFRQAGGRAAALDSQSVIGTAAVTPADGVGAAPRSTSPDAGLTPVVGQDGVPVTPSRVLTDTGRLLPIRRRLGRTTVLLLGVDARTQDAETWRTDTIMLLTLDPHARQAGVLSIPRDLWVPIPDHDNDRINAAFSLGESSGYPGGGAALAMETVEYNFGVSVDYYARVDFQGFTTLIDLIGGIDINVEHAIDDPNYPYWGPEGETYGPLTIEAGPQHFDGDMALKYARTRYGTGDIDRTRRQQQILFAVLKRVATLKLLPSLVDNAPEIYETLQASVQTDMSLDHVLKLATEAARVDRAAIRSGVIDNTCVQPWTTPTGGQVLLPRWDEIRAVRDDVFAVATSPAESTP